MSVFCLDIERYYQAQRKNGFDLKAIVCIQYPIYCIHADILVTTPDPLEKLDKAILNCILFKEGITSLEISQILSLQKNVVDFRIDQLKGEKLLNDSNSLTISEYGIEVIIDGTEKRLHSMSYDFYLDGIDFQPLPERFYDLKYRSAFFSENDVTYYTDSRGNTQTTKQFHPNVVHEPIEKDKVIRHIFYVSPDERIKCNIPEGLEEIKNIDFTKMTFPLLVALLLKDGKPHRKVLDGFSVKGENDFLVHFEAKISERLKNLELRLDTFEDSSSEEKRCKFLSNWGEIDLERSVDGIFMVSKEDLKIAFKNIYKLNVSGSDNLLVNEFEIGINVTEELLSNMNTGRNDLIRHLTRGRDYKFGSPFNTGIWIYFVTFKTDSLFVKDLIEIYQFLREAKDMKLLLKSIFERIEKYHEFRKTLVILEEYEILESYDINKYMKVIGE